MFSCVDEFPLVNAWALQSWGYRAGVFMFSCLFLMSYIWGRLKSIHVQGWTKNHKEIGCQMAHMAVKEGGWLWPVGSPLPRLMRADERGGNWFVQARFGWAGPKFYNSGPTVAHETVSLTIWPRPRTVRRTSPCTAHLLRTSPIGVGA